MKKAFMIVFMGMVFVETASAGFVADTSASKGGFVADAEKVISVAQVKEMRDDVPVIVSGHIVQRMGKDKYLFQDTTGSIVVEIDDEDWRGQTVTPEDTVRLSGEVDRGMFKTEIEADYVEKM